MPLPTRLFPGDEELGKRDDDHKAGAKPTFGVFWQHRRLPLRRNIRRTAWLLLVVTGLCVFFKKIPIDLQSYRGHPSYIDSSWDEAGDSFESWAKSKTLTDGTKLPDSHWPKHLHDRPDSMGQHTFNGPIDFSELAPSLRATSVKGGNMAWNKNVLFAASSIRSAAVLLPLACEMGRWKRNNVHFAFMGRDDIPMTTLMEVNGITDDCEISYHDARPDYSVQSSDFRMEVSCGAALNHFTTYMHPQVVIIDNSGLEEPFFISAMRDKAPLLGTTLIELPARPEQNLMWLTRLDCSSLKAWNSFSIDILIHAQPGASGSLIRLLKSLSKADYFNLIAPHITIELPHVTDEPTQQFLSKSFNWPPGNHPASGNTNHVTLHHRILDHSLTPEESSVRVIESFWPTNPATSHVLILSPQAELSPLYFHYLQYSILEYRYSLRSTNHYDNLMGISLDLPSTYLNDTTALVIPFSKAADSSSEMKTGASSFLWQSPNSNAALYFGTKWTELHSFISNSITSTHTSQTPSRPASKLVSNTYPSWLEHILELARIRGYYTLYPVLETSDALVTIHNDLYQPPEEFKDNFESKSRDYGAGKGVGDDTDWTVDPLDHLSLQHKEMPLASTTLLNLLPAAQPLATLHDIPILSWDGDNLDSLEFSKRAKMYEEYFARERGGCTTPNIRKERLLGDAEDLFCVG